MAAFTYGDRLRLARLLVERAAADVEDLRARAAAVRLELAQAEETHLVETRHLDRIAAETGSRAA
jgi:hypothetical protein